MATTRAFPRNRCFHRYMAKCQCPENAWPGHDGIHINEKSRPNLVISKMPSRSILPSAGRGIQVPMSIGPSAYICPALLVLAANWNSNSGNPETSEGPECGDFRGPA